MGNIHNSLFSKMLIIGVIQRIGLIIKLMKIQRLSKFGCGSEVPKNDNNAGIGQPSGC